MRDYLNYPNSHEYSVVVNELLDRAVILNELPYPCIQGSSDALYRFFFSFGIDSALPICEVLAMQRVQKVIDKY